MAKKARQRRRRRGLLLSPSLNLRKRQAVVVAGGRIAKKMGASWRLSACSEGSGGGGRDWSGLPGLVLLCVLRCMGGLAAADTLRAFSRVCRAWRSVAEWYLIAQPPLLLAYSRPPLLLAYSSADRYAAAAGESRDPSLGLYSFPDGRFHRRKNLQMPPVLLCEGVQIVGYSCGYLLVTGPGRGGRHRLFLVDPLADGAEAIAHIELPAAPCLISQALLTASPATTSGGGVVVVALDIANIQTYRIGDPAWMVFQFPSQHHRLWMGNLSLSAVSLGDDIYVLLRTGDVLVFKVLPTLSMMACLHVEGLTDVKAPSVSDFLADLNGQILMLLDLNEEEKEEERGPIIPSWRRFCWSCKARMVMGSCSHHRYALYRLDLSARQWVRLNSLGNHSLFLNSIGMSMLCDPAAWGGSRNCIYRLCVASGKMNVFHLEDGAVERHPFPLLHHPVTPPYLQALHSFFWMLPSPPDWL